MSIKERLKHSPYIKNWKFPVIYFAIGAVLSVLFIRRVIIDAPYNSIATFATIPLSVVLIYAIYIASDMLSANFVIKDHRQTPFLFAVILGIVSFLFFLVRFFVWHNFEMAIIYPSIALQLIALAYHFYRFRHDEAESIMSYGIVFGTLGLMLYCLVSFLLGNYGGISLVPLLFGTLIGGGIFALGIVLRKKQLQSEIPQSTLDKRSELFVAKLFKGLPMTDELIALREQITASLKEYMEVNVRSGISANKLFSEAVNSLGDYSALLYPYRKNFLARFAGSTNRATNILFGAVLQIGITLFYTFSLAHSDWASGSNELMYETSPVLIFIVLACIAVLLILRTVENFRHKRHLTTPLSIGLFVLTPLVIVFMILNLDRYNTAVLTLLQLLIVLGIIALIIIAQVITIIMIKRRKQR
ncbi:MAG: hypothetical protein WC292_06250 [Clostridia bacterium]